jgi:hypothetical protein
VAAAERSSFVVVVVDAQPMEHDDVREGQAGADYRGEDILFCAFASCTVPYPTFSSDTCQPSPWKWILQRSGGAGGALFVSFWACRPALTPSRWSCVATEVSRPKRMVMFLQGGERGDQAYLDLACKVVVVPRSQQIR